MSPLLKEIVRLFPIYSVTGLPFLEQSAVRALTGEKA